MTIPVLSLTFKNMGDEELASARMWSPRTSACSSPRDTSTGTATVVSKENIKQGGVLVHQQVVDHRDELLQQDDFRLDVGRSRPSAGRATAVCKNNSYHDVDNTRGKNMTFTFSDGLFNSGTTTGGELSMMHLRTPMNCNLRRTTSTVEHDEGGTNCGTSMQEDEDHHHNHLHEDERFASKQKSPDFWLKIDDDEEMDMLHLLDVESGRTTSRNHGGGTSFGQESHRTASGATAATSANPSSSSGGQETTRAAASNDVEMVDQTTVDIKQDQQQGSEISNTTGVVKDLDASTKTLSTSSTTPSPPNPEAAVPAMKKYQRVSDVRKLFEEELSQACQPHEPLVQSAMETLAEPRRTGERMLFNAKVFQARKCFEEKNLLLSRPFNHGGDRMYDYVSLILRQSQAGTRTRNENGEDHGGVRDRLAQQRGQQQAAPGGPHEDRRVVQEPQHLLHQDQIITARRTDETNTTQEQLHQEQQKEQEPRFNTHLLLEVNGACIFVSPVANFPGRGIFPEDDELDNVEDQHESSPVARNNLNNRPSKNNLSSNNLWLRFGIPRPFKYLHLNFVNVADKNLFVMILHQLSTFPFAKLPNLPLEEFVRFCFADDIREQILCNKNLFDDNYFHLMRNKWKNDNEKNRSGENGTTSMTKNKNSTITNPIPDPEQIRNSFEKYEHLRSNLHLLEFATVDSNTGCFVDSDTAFSDLVQYSPRTTAVGEGENWGTENNSKETWSDEEERLGIFSAEAENSDQDNDVKRPPPGPTGPQEKELDVYVVLPFDSANY
ncbi:unnamed protein product [Amoebophrya sp. A120]|nr:unnamed protein product [Amoebophrya sp. A120]|eukprot:GSA120T00006995001.1